MITKTSPLSFNFHFLLIASFKSLPALNLTPLEAGISNFSPVYGLPSLAERSDT